MLTEIYIEAQLVDEELADQAWNHWDQWMIFDDLAALAWCILATTERYGSKLRERRGVFMV